MLRGQISVFPQKWKSRGSHASSSVRSLLIRTSCPHPLQMLLAKYWNRIYHNCWSLSGKPSKYVRIGANQWLKRWIKMTVDSTVKIVEESVQGTVHPNCQQGLIPTRYLVLTMGVRMRIKLFSIRWGLRQPHFHFAANIRTHTHTTSIDPRFLRFVIWKRRLTSPNLQFCGLVSHWTQGQKKSFLLFSRQKRTAETEPVFNWVEHKKVIFVRFVLSHSSPSPWQSKWLWESSYHQGIGYIYISQSLKSLT